MDRGGASLVKVDPAAGTFKDHTGHDEYRFAWRKSFRSIGVSSMVIDSSGDIWLSLLGAGGLAKFDRKQDTVLLWDVPVARSRPYGITLDRDGKVWFADYHSSGVTSFDPRTESFRHYRVTLEATSNIRRLIADSKNNIWPSTWGSLGYQNAAIYRVHPVSGEVDRFRLEIPYANPYDVEVDDRDKLWIATDNHVVHLDPDTRRFVFHPVTTRTDIPKLAVTRDGAVWFAPRNAGQFGGYGGAATVLYPDKDRITSFAAHYRDDHARFGALVEDAAARHRLGYDIMAPGGRIGSPGAAVSLGLTLIFGPAGLPHVLMRFFTVPTVVEARRSVLVATLLITVFCFLMLVIGFGSIALLVGDARYVDAGGSLVGGRNMAALHLAHAMGGDALLGLFAAVAFAFGGFGILLSLAFQHENITFLSATAMSVAASSTFPVLILSLFWARLTTLGAIAGGTAGLLTAVCAIVLGPSVRVAVFDNPAPVFPYQYPTIVAMSLAFAVAVGASLLKRKVYPRPRGDSRADGRTALVASATQTDLEIGEARLLEEPGRADLIAPPEVLGGIAPAGADQRHQLLVRGNGSVGASLEGLLRGAILAFEKFGVGLRRNPVDDARQQAQGVIPGQTD